MPNNAVLGQWARSWDTMFAGRSPAGTDRSLDQPRTVLTYQSVAVIDDDTPAPVRRQVLTLTGAGVTARQWVDVATGTTWH